MLDEKLMIGRSQVSFDEWVEYAALQLPHALKGYATMQKMVDTLTEDSARDARNLLTTRFLPANCPIALGDPNEEKLGRFLAAEGALVQADGNTFTIPSPLVHTLLMGKVVSKDKRKPPNDPVPFTEEKALDIVALIRGALKAFHPKAVDTALLQSFKQGEGPGIAGKRVPSEISYHIELRNVLASWLPVQVAVASEANAPALETQPKLGRPPRCDIFINSAGHCYALELMASGDEASVKEHIERIKQYKMVLKAKEGWLIHFTLATAPFRPSADDLEDESVKVITISHDISWTHATMHVTGGEPFRVQLRDKLKVEIEVLSSNPSKMRVAELREQLQKRGLDTKGDKAALVRHLTQALAKEDAERKGHRN